MQKLYTEDWDLEKASFLPYSDSPELRRVAKAQEALSDVSTGQSVVPMSPTMA